MTETNQPDQPEEVRVIRSGTSWTVIDEAGTVIAEGLSHAAAWKLADRLHFEVASPAEKRTDYAWRRRNDR